MNFGPTEMFIILVIVLVLFGAGRVSRLGGEMGTAIREFRKALQGDDESSQDTDTSQDHSSQAS